MKRLQPTYTPALFLHIQKTAGSSLVHLARQFYGDSMTSHGDCWKHSPEDLQDVAFVSGHIGFDYARRLMSNRFAFTFLRDPIDRVLSMYYFCRTRDPAEFMIYRRASELGLEEFLHAGFTDPWVKKNIWNNQVWQLAHGYAHLDGRTIDDFQADTLLALAIEHVQQLSYVGFTERTDHDIPFLLSQLGIPLPATPPKLNTTPNRPKASTLSSYARQMLTRLTELDRELYEYAWNKLRGRLLHNKQGDICS